MEQFIEKLIGRLKKYQIEYKSGFGELTDETVFRVMENVIYTVKELAEEYMTCYKSCTECEAYDKEKHNCPKFCYIIAETVKEIEENNNGWIPCSDKYPEDNQIVLTIDSEGNMEVLDYDTNWENSFCKYGGTVKVFNIIAWQPLPEPYKAKGE